MRALVQAVGCFLALWPVTVAAQTPWGIGFDDAVGGPDVAAVFPAAGLGLSTPAHVRVVIARSALEPSPGQFDFAPLDAHLARYRGRPGFDVVLQIDGAWSSADSLTTWPALTRALVRRYQSLVRCYIVEANGAAAARPPAREYAFLLKTLAIEARAVDADTGIFVGGVKADDASWLETTYADDLAPYASGVAVIAGVDTRAIEVIVDRRDPTALVVQTGVDLGAASDAGERLVRSLLGVLGTRVTGVTFRGAPEAVAAALPVIAALGDLIAQPMETIEDSTAGLTVDEGAFSFHRLVFGLDTAATYLIYASPDRSVTVGLTEPTGAAPVVRDAVTHTRRTPSTFRYEPGSRRATLGLPASAYPLVVDWTGDRPARVDRASVSSQSMPDLAEIIARHQQAQAAQDARISTYIVDATMSQHFRPTVADPGFDVVTENRFYVGNGQTEFEELSFRLNGTRWGPDRPPFPLLQAEKVLSLPLDLRLNADYRYRLEGLDRVDGRECFVVRFDPAHEDRSLYRGTVWIDRETSLKVRVHTIQTKLATPLLSSEETQHFSAVAVEGGRELRLLSKLDGQQNILIAGRSLLLERHVSFHDFQVNLADFDARRDAARQSDRIMYRDTERGLRYLVEREGQRVVDERTTTRAKAMLIGVMVDPAYDFPLPLGGLNYLNFEFLGPDSQLAVLYGGVLALINAQRPQILGDRLDASVDVFAIAVPGSDRTYDEDGEVTSERVWTVPFTTGVNFGWRPTERIRLTGSYQFRFDAYFHDTSVAPDFVTPASTATNGLGLSAEWKRNGYAVVVGWAGYRRATWRAWGEPGDYDPAQRDYSRQMASITKEFFSGVHKFRLNGAYYGGHDLDRFSRYQFGFFDEHRIRGVPSAGVRFDALGMVRVSYGMNVFDQLRVELGLDQAYGRDQSVSRAWQPITGVGFGFLMRGPRNTMLRSDVGKSFLPDRYREPGSWVFQFQVLKPL